MPDVLLKFHNDSCQAVPLGGLQAHQFKAKRAPFCPPYDRSIDFHRPGVVR